MASHDDSSSAGGEEAPSPQLIEDADENTIRIMVSTDNHLGYLETDAVRGNDSFAAMEEVLYLAKHYQCDLVLLAGDLFHHNKPSRLTLHKTMSIFRKYCMGPNPISIQIVSDQSQNFRRGVVNYQDEFYSVDLPVLSIHGNHDDPSREGSSELFAALDLLDCANLVNYIGRQDNIKQVQIAPILMKKGDTHLALYGLGSMRDERLNRMWQQSNVTFMRPSDGEQDNDSVEWFNLFALHQNRDKGRGTKNCVHESMIPEWMDLVVWGHEHESLVEPQESVVGTFRISQPGSSVATSLVAGESVRKKVGILDIRGNNFRLRGIPLTQVRTFTMADVSLTEHRGLDPDDPKIDVKVKQVLEEEVELLIHQAKNVAKELRQEAREMGNVLAEAAEYPLINKIEKPDEVLIRLRVEHVGFSAINNQRFGAQFIGRIANPTDILLFHRRKILQNKVSTANKKRSKVEPIIPEQLEEMNIEDFIVGELELSDRKLELFDEGRIATALDAYVQKQHAQAIAEGVDELLNKHQKKLIKQGPLEGDDDDEVIPIDKDMNESLKPSKRGSTKTVGPKDVETVESEPPKRNSRSRKNPVGKQATSNYESQESDVEYGENAPKSAKERVRSKRKKTFNNDESDDHIEIVEATKRTTPTRRTRMATTSIYMEDSDESIIEESPPERKAAPKNKPRRAATSSQYSTGKPLSQSQLSFVPGKRRGLAGNTSRKRNALTLDSDDDENQQTHTKSYDLDEDWGTAKTDTFN